MEGSWKVKMTHNGLRTKWGAFFSFFRFLENFTKSFPRKLFPDICEGGCPRHLICALCVRLDPVRLSEFCRVRIGCVCGEVIAMSPGHASLLLVVILEITQIGK